MIYREPWVKETESFQRQIQRLRQEMRLGDPKAIQDYYRLMERLGMTELSQMFPDAPVQAVIEADPPVEVVLQDTYGTFLVGESLAILNNRELDLIRERHPRTGEDWEDLPNWLTSGYVDAGFYTKENERVSIGEAGVYVDPSELSDSGHVAGGESGPSESWLTYRVSEALQIIKKRSLEGGIFERIQKLVSETIITDIPTYLKNSKVFNEEWYLGGFRRHVDWSGIRAKETRFLDIGGWDLSRKDHALWLKWVRELVGPEQH